MRHWPLPDSRGSAMVGLCLLLVWGAAGARGQELPAVYRAERYVVRWSAGEVGFLTPERRLLCRWPVGALCSPADPDLPVTSSLLDPQTPPTQSTVHGVPQLTWTWRFPDAAPLAEQVETYRLLPDRVEVRVRVRWRGQPPRLVRMVYGARLAAGCCDLEGLWRVSHSPPAAAIWQVEPVPGVYPETGDAWFRKRVRLGPSAQDLLLVVGGIDDGDVTSWNGQEIGRTPTDTNTASWTQVRRYALPRPSSRADEDQELLIQVHNAAGNGGLWRGPLVLGSPAAIEATPTHDGWTRASATGRALHHWCPDRYEQPLQDRFTVSLTSQDRTREFVPENVTSGGRFLLPPYIVALEGDYGWWGIGTLDLPRAEDGLRVEWREGTLSCPFLLATEPQAKAGGWTNGPRVALLTGDSKADVLNTYLGALPPRRPSHREDWWSGPCYCTWGDQVYNTRVFSGSDVGALTDAHLRKWLGALHEKGIAAPLVTLDAGWWQLSPQVIADLHAEGRHATVWTQPHWGPDTTQHSERAMRDFDGRPLAYDPNNWVLDYTRPDVRRHMAEAFRSYVARDGWDADGIKLDFCYTAAPVWAIYADPSWGAGEQYRARVLRFVYRTIKGAKPEALVTGATVNPLFGRVQDVCRLNEDWVGDEQLFRRRAAAVLALGEWAECDDWNAYEHYLAPQAVERPVWGTFTLMSALYRGDRRNNPVPISAAWAARLSAITALSQHIPVRAGQRCLYDPERGLLRRETANSELVATALPLAGSTLPLQVLIVADGDRLLVCAVADGRVRLPIDRPVRAVVAVLHDGTRRPAGRGESELAVTDSAGDVAYYEVTLVPCQP